MRKISRQYINWKRKQNEKNLLIRTERKELAKIRKHKKNKRKISLRREINNNMISYRKEFVAPSSFSFVHNPEETIEYFNRIISFITNKDNYKCSLFFDVSKIKVLTIDALMYLLSIINNLRTKYKNKYVFSGNEPDEPSLKKTFKESGFYSFVNYKGNDSLQKNKDNIQIAYGKKCENDVAKKMSDFVVEKFGVEKKNLGFLYDIMIEMMSNTYRHAYNDKKRILEPVWYCFAEYDRLGTISFSFMDTGSGIPSTVKKNFFETIDFLNLKSEYEYVVSALNGDFRTSTEQYYRGKGLPKIRNYCENGVISNMHIVANKADVSINKNKYRNRDLNNSLSGTLYYWSLKMIDIVGG